MNTKRDKGRHRFSANVIEDKKKKEAAAFCLLHGAIKFSMMSAPFLSMMIMLLALWGIVGKTTYTDADDMKRGIGTDVPEAKNYLVNETKNSEQCGKEVQNAGENPMPEKIDWEHVV